MPQTNDKAKQQINFQAFASSLKTSLKQTPADSIDVGAVTKISMEGFGAPDSLVGAAKTMVTSMEAHIRAACVAAGANFEDLTKQQIEAVGVVLAKGRDRKNVTTLSVDLQSFENVQGANCYGVFDNVPKGVFVSAERFKGLGFKGEIVTTESYDARNLFDFMAVSAVVAMTAARQDPFGEAFFQTSVQPNGGTGVELKIDRQMVQQHILHAQNGNPTDFGRINLLEAARDVNLLTTNSIKVVPYYDATSAASIAKFTPQAIIPAYDTTINGVTFKTAPLAPGLVTGVSLLGIGTNPAIVSLGNPDQTDSLDMSVGFENLYLQLADNAGTPNKSVLKFNVLRLPRSRFMTALEGRSRQMEVNFTTDMLPLTKDTVDYLGANAAAVAGYFSGANANNQLRIRIAISGTLDLEYGNLVVNTATPQIVAVYTAPLVAGGPLQDITSNSTLSAAAVALPNLAFVGFDIDASRSNVNRRDTGTLIVTQPERDRFIIPLSSPFTAIVPAFDIGVPDMDISGPLTASNLHNSSVAVLKLLDYADSLKAYCSASVMKANGQIVVGEIEGYGRWLVRPYYSEVNLDFEVALNSIRTKDRMDDVRALLVNAITSQSNLALLQSNYQTVLVNQTKNQNARAHVQIGTDQNIMQYLMTVGDTRTLGPMIDYDFVGTVASKMENIIIGVFNVPSTTTPLPYNFGNMLYTPELVSTLQVSRNGQVSKEICVQPRIRHIVTCPILFRIYVKNLPAMFTEQVAFPMQLV